MIETLACEYSFERTQRELSNEYQYDRVWMVFKKNLCVLRTKIASAFEGLKKVIQKETGCRELAVLALE